MSTFDADFADKFHIWRMEWTDEAIRIYLDDRLLNETKLDRTVNANPGQSWYNVDNYNPYRDPENKQRMWLNFALGVIMVVRWPTQYCLQNIWSIMCVYMSRMEKRLSLVWR